MVGQATVDLVDWCSPIIDVAHTEFPITHVAQHRIPEARLIVTGTDAGFSVKKRRRY